MEMGQKIYNLRIQKGLTLEELGNMVGVGKSTVRKWENGMIANMKRDKILKVSEALDTTPAYLMGWEEEEKSKDEPPKIMQYYEKLNDIGKHEATRQVKLLAEVPRYKKGYSEFSENLTPEEDYLKPQAAHNDNESEEQLAPMQEDMSILKRPE